MNLITYDNCVDFITGLKSDLHTMTCLCWGKKLCIKIGINLIILYEKPVRLTTQTNLSRENTWVLDHFCVMDLLLGYHLELIQNW